MEREIQQQFGAVAENYVASVVHARGEDLPILRRAAALRREEWVLDLGTAVGHTAFMLAPDAAQVVGVDLTTEMLDRATRLAGERQVTNVTFARADVGHLPFSDSAFDLVTSRYSAHHYGQPSRVVAEVDRVLKPGGRFLLSDTVAPDDPALDTFINTVELLRDRSHVRDHTIAQWQTLLAGAGLQNEVVHTWNLRLDFSDWIERMRTPVQYVEILRALLRDAPTGARHAFSIEREEPLSFCLKGALILARKSHR